QIILCVVKYIPSGVCVSVQERAQVLHTEAAHSSRSRKSPQPKQKKQWQQSAPSRGKAYRSRMFCGGSSLHLWFWSSRRNGFPVLDCTHLSGIQWAIVQKDVFHLHISFLAGILTARAKAKPKKLKWRLTF
ncbi:exo-alpha-sialidase, partial [Trypanosoma cruzi]